MFAGATDPGYFTTGTCKSKGNFKVTTITYKRPGNLVASAPGPNPADRTCNTGVVSYVNLYYCNAKASDGSTPVKDDCIKSGADVNSVSASLVRRTQISHCLPAVSVSTSVRTVSGLFGLQAQFVCVQPPLVLWKPAAGSSYSAIDIPHAIGHSLHLAQPRVRADCHSNMQDVPCTTSGTIIKLAGHDGSYQGLANVGSSDACAVGIQGCAGGDEGKVCTYGCVKVACTSVATGAPCVVTKAPCV